MEGIILQDAEDPDAMTEAGRRHRLHPTSASRSGKKVLVLNCNWLPVNIIDARRAFTLLFREDARIICPDGADEATFDIGEWIDYSLNHPPVEERDAMHTVRLMLRIPDVLILSGYDQLPMKETRLSRENIFARDGYVCQYCGHKFAVSQLSVDHVIPRERGGRNTWENLVTACKVCNEKKANRMPHEAGMHLVGKPRRPPRLPFAATAALRHDVEPVWKAFLPEIQSEGVVRNANRE
jgi:5-methylcytosine-specific restriction endonuclease McrA